MGEHDFLSGLDGIPQEIEVIPHEFNPQRKYVFELEETIDLTPTPTGKAIRVGKLDLQRSRQFSYTNSGVVERLTTRSGQEEALKHTSDPNARERIETLMRTGFLWPEKGEEIPTVLYHCGASIFTNEWRNLVGKPVNKLQRLLKHGVYGRTNGLTYITDKNNTAIAHGVGDLSLITNHGSKYPEARVLLLTINTAVLSENRNIFIDPESLEMENEFWHSFVIHGGIPVAAISKIDVMKYKGERIS